MKKVILSSFILLASSISPSLSFADSASQNQEIIERFTKCDTNKDGKLTKEEAKGCMPRVYNNFSYIDSANKGYVTLAQIQALAS
jgi:Ca2+-binding EF-hand superfamily protein